MLFESMHPSWQELLATRKQALEGIEQTILKIPNLTPAPNRIMRAFEQDPKLTRVLIIGQDPYPTEGVACGLAFAIEPGAKLPQSLRNLMSELSNDLPESTAAGDLLRWQSQGVMPLNAALTTEIGSPGAHQKIWQGFTRDVIAALHGYLGGRFVTLALGQSAQRLANQCALEPVVSAPHPSPLSAPRGFFGSRVFSRVNQELKKLSLPAVDWSC